MVWNKELYMIENLNSNIETLKEGLAQTKNVAIIKNINLVTIVVTNKDIEHTEIAKVFETDSILKLKKKLRIKINELNIKMATPNNLEQIDSNEIAVGLWLPENQVDKLLESNARVLIYIPWIQEEGKEWKRKWNPIILGKSSWEVNYLILDPLVEEALKQLSTTINLSTGITHKLDKETAEVKFKELESKGIKSDPEAIRIWAIKNHWDFEKANELKRMADKYYNPKK